MVVILNCCVHLLFLGKGLESLLYILFVRFVRCTRNNRRKKNKIYSVQHIVFDEVILFINLSKESFELN